MKRTIMITALALLMTGIAVPTFAETYEKSLGQIQKVIVGRVEAVTPEKKEFILTDKDNGKATKVYTTASVAGNLNAGDNVRVVFSSGNFASRVSK